MTGIKFRRNEKANLLNIASGEIVYAMDTNEWGLGLPNATVVWRKHEILFPNLFLRGEGTPDINLGSAGMYYFDLTNFIVYRKGGFWEELDYPISQTVIDANYLAKGSVPNYDDFSNIIKKDGSVKLPNGYVSTDGLGVVSKDEVLGKLGVLKSDGSNSMRDGYVASGDFPLTMGSRVSYVPPKVKPEDGGILWNDKGIPKLSISFNFYKKLYGRYDDPNGVWGSWFGYNVKIHNGIIAVVDPDIWSDLPTPHYSEICLYNLAGDKLQTIYRLWDSGDRQDSLGEYSLVLNSTRVGGGHNYGDGQFFLWDLSGNMIKVIVQPQSFTGDGFGDLAGMNSNNLFIGGYKYNGPSQGVYVYDLQGNYISKIVSNEAALTFGGMIYANDDYLMISTNTTVEVFDASTFAYIRTLTSASATIGFGFAMFQRGNYFYIGDHKYDNKTGESNKYNTGKAYVFDLNGNVVNTMYGDTTKRQTLFSYSLTADDEYLVIGDLDYSTSPGSYGQGAIFIYELDGTFIKVVQPTDTVMDEDTADYFGWSVAMENGTIVVGAWDDDEGDPDDILHTQWAGSAYLFKTSKLV